jgi:hypothetical protein
MEGWRFDHRLRLVQLVRLLPLVRLVQLVRLLQLVPLVRLAQWGLEYQLALQVPPVLLPLVALMVLLVQIHLVALMVLALLEVLEAQQQPPPLHLHLFHYRLYLY